MAAEVNLQVLLEGEMASNLASMARAHVNIMDLQERAFLAKLTKVDLAEAAAAKELAKSGIATDLAGVRAGFATPPLPGDKA